MGIIFAKRRPNGRIIEIRWTPFKCDEDWLLARRREVKKRIDAEIVGMIRTDLEYSWRSASDAEQAFAAIKDGDYIRNLVMG